MQQKEELDLSQFPVMAKKQGGHPHTIYVFYHVMPHPRIWGQVILVPTGETTAATPHPKYQKGKKSKSQEILEFILEHQDGAIENFKAELKENFKRKIEELKTSTEELEDVTEAYQGTEPGDIPK